MKWTTVTEFIDGETGEVLSYSQYKKHDYITIVTIKLPSIYGKTHSIKKIRRICRRNNQCTLF